MKSIIDRMVVKGKAVRNALVAVFALVVGAAMPSFAADWTDANNATYTALKSINGGGSGYIATDFTPAGTDTVKFKYKPSTVNGDECIYCSRYDDGGYMKKQFCGFRIGSAFRVDSHDHYKSSGNTIYTRQFFCNTTKPLTPSTEYILSADYNNAVVTINGTEQTLTASPASDRMATSRFTPGSILVLLASHTSTAADAASAATLTGIGDLATGDLYYFQLWSKEGTLSHNFMPAKRDSDSAVGLYDTVIGKFYPATDGSLTGATYDASERAGKKWTGLGGDNKMSNAANWEGGVAPQAGDNIDFTIAVPFAAIVADIDATFGKIYLGAGDLPAFSGTLTAIAVNDLARMQAYDTATDDFTFTPANLTWNGGAAANWNTTDASWLYNSAASVWYDNNNAIFNTADATATLTADATANSLTFNQNAIVAGSATLTVPTVSVATDVSATISAPTAGALTKTGAGTLTLGSSRTEQTTVSEGTLAMASGATLDVTKLTLGTDPAKPVSLNLGGAGLSADLTARMSAMVGGAAGGSVAIDNGAITNTANLRVRNGSLTLGSDAQVTMNGSDLWVCVGGNGSGDESVTTNDACLVLDGASIKESVIDNNTRLAIGDFGSYPSKGTMIVKNGGSFTTDNSAYVAHGCEGHLVIDGEGSSVTAYRLLFCNETRCAANENGYVVVTNGGTLAVRALGYGSGKGEGYFRFDGGTLRATTAGMTLLPAHEKLHYEVGAEGGTIDNDGNNITIAQGLSGTGTINLTGSGTTTFAAGVGAEGGVSVADGTTLEITATAQSSFGSLTLAAGSTLDIANYDGTTPVVVGALALPSEGTVNLKLNGGAFGKGIYAIFSAQGVTAEEGGKFSFTTENGESASWSVADGTLLLTVGDISGNYWTGRGGDGKMSTAANWLNGVPAAGADIDLSFVSSATTIIADADRTFGAVTMGTGVITFTNSLTATSFSDTSKVVVGVDSTVTVDGDLVFSGGVNEYIVNNVASGGTFRVTGHIVADAAKTEIILPCCTTSIAGTIEAKGLINNSSNGVFLLARNVDGSHVNWAIGADGIGGTALTGYTVDTNVKDISATITATTNFTVSTGIVNRKALTFDAAGYTITLGTNISVAAGGIIGRSGTGASLTIKGPGRVIVNYDVDKLTTSKVCPFVVNDTATLALMPGTDIGSGMVTVHDGSTLEIASGTMTLGGGLTLNDGATLAFNFTERSVTPQIAIADGKTLTVNGAVKVKIAEDSLRPTVGKKVLTTCGGFDAEGVTVSLAAGAPKWVSGLSVNDDGNIVLDVKPMGMLIIFR